jgi:hypothetical protein
VTDMGANEEFSGRNAAAWLGKHLRTKAVYLAITCPKLGTRGTGVITLPAISTSGSMASPHYLFALILVLAVGEQMLWFGLSIAGVVLAWRPSPTRKPKDGTDVWSNLMK